MMNDGGMYGWGMLGGWGLAHWLFFVPMAAVILYPVGVILNRLGYSPFWSVLAFLPGVNIIGLWVVALGMGSPNTRANRQGNQRGAGDGRDHASS